MRTITNFKTLLVLFFSMAMIAFVGCEEDGKDVPTPNPEPTAASYLIGGKVLDAANAPMSGVSISLSGAQTLSVTSGADGAYSFDLKGTPGSYKVVFKLEGFVDRSYDVEVKKIETGLGQYIVNAIMVKGVTPEKPKEYKKAKYNLSISAQDANGKAITASDLSVVVKYGDKQVAKESKANFEVLDVAPGIYDIEATAKGFSKALAKLVVSAVPDQEKKDGEGDTFDVQYPAVILMNAAPTDPDTPVDPDPEDPENPSDPSDPSDPVTPPATPAVYIVSGDVKDLNSDAAVSAEITLKTKAGADLGTKNGSTFSFENGITANAELILTVKADSYATYSYPFKMEEVAAGQTFKMNIPVRLNKVGSGGNVEINFSETGEELADTEKNSIKDAIVAAGSSSEAVKIPNISYTDSDGNSGKVEVIIPAAVLDSYKGEGGTVLPPEVKVLTQTEVTELLKEPIKSTTADGKEESDNVSLTAESGKPVIIVMPAGSNQALTIARDMASEALQSDKVASDVKGVSASVSRVYTGAPSGTVFSPALTIKFDAPADLAASTQPMALLYEKDGKMEIDNTAEPVTISGGGATMLVSHFSKFAAGFELTSIKDEVSTPDTTIIKEVEDYYSENAPGSIPVIVTTTNKFVGEDLETAVKNSKIEDAAKNAVYNRILKRLQADGYAIGVESAIKTTVATDKGGTVASMKITKTHVTNTYTFKYMTKAGEVKEITVTAKKLIKVDGKVEYKQSHGHGHGDGNNAGGGIIIPD